MFKGPHSVVTRTKISAGMRGKQNCLGQVRPSDVCAKIRVGMRGKKNAQLYPFGTICETAKGHLRVNAGTGWIGVHRLVYENTYGPIPDGHVVHHIDLDPSNNAPENLEAMTYSEHRKLHSALCEAK